MWAPLWKKRFWQFVGLQNSGVCYRCVWHKSSAMILEKLLLPMRPFLNHLKSIILQWNRFTSGKYSRQLPAWCPIKSTPRSDCAMLRVIAKSPRATSQTLHVKVKDSRTGIRQNNDSVCGRAVRRNPLLAKLNTAETMCFGQMRPKQRYLAIMCNTTLGESQTHTNL